MSARRESRRDLFVLVGPMEKPVLLQDWVSTALSREHSVFFVGVDGGVDVLRRAKLPIGLAIGDWDSLRSHSILGEVTHVTLAEEKDRSDLHHALRAVAELGAHRVIARGFQGGRMDHEWAAQLDFAVAAENFRALTSLGQRGTCHFLGTRAGKARSLTLTALRKGQTLSLLPLEAVAGLHLEGLRFQAPGGILGISSQGLSNRVSRTPVRISLRRGKLIVLIPSEGNV